MIWQHAGGCRWFRCSNTVQQWYTLDISMGTMERTFGSSCGFVEQSCSKSTVVALWTTLLMDERPYILWVKDNAPAFLVWVTEKMFDEEFLWKDAVRRGCDHFFGGTGTWDLEWLSSCSMWKANSKGDAERVLEEGAMHYKNRSVQKESEFPIVKKKKE